jgi:hypothetical protein
MTVQPVEVTFDNLPLPRAEIAVVAHAVNFAENPVQFFIETSRFLPGK